MVFSLRSFRNEFFGRNIFFEQIRIQHKELCGGDPERSSLGFVCGFVVVSGSIRFALGLCSGSPTEEDYVGLHFGIGRIAIWLG